MGLDMFAFAIPAEFAGEAQVDLNPPKGSIEEIAYWRKHGNLHGWMEQLYRRKGGTRQFNCTTVRITTADLDELYQAVNGEQLPATTGFFFGHSQPEDMDLDVAFIAKARELLAAGKAIVYYSWW